MIAAEQNRKVIKLMECLSDRSSTDSQTVNMATGLAWLRYGRVAEFCDPVLFWCGPGSSVGIATGYGLDGPGIESRWGGGGGEVLAHVQTGRGTHPASCTMGTGSFPGVKRPRGGADHPLLAPRSRKSRAILYPPSRSSRPVIGRTLFLIWWLKYSKL
jgi:hypothetical protein